MDITDNKIAEIKYRIEDYLLFSLSNEDSLHFLKEQEHKLYDAIDLFVMRNAKRIRPILLLLTYYGFSKQDEESVIHAAVALELMHTFALIHDDIIDQSMMRDKTPSLYHAIDRISGKKDFGGERMAMLIGDLIYNIALNEFQKVKLKRDEKVAGMELLLDTALKTGYGQLQELVQGTRNLAGITPNQILKIYDLKTAYYTFCLPLQLGALLAGDKKRDLKPLKEIGLKLGRAYQIIDDINDFSPANLESNNYLFALLWQEADKEERKKLRKLYSSLKEKPQETEWLKDLFSKYNIIRIATTAVYNLLAEGKAGIKELVLNGDSHEEIIDYVDSIMKIKK